MHLCRVRCFKDATLWNVKTSFRLFYSHLNTFQRVFCTWFAGGCYYQYSFMSNLYNLPELYLFLGLIYYNISILGAYSDPDLKIGKQVNIIMPVHSHIDFFYCIPKCKYNYWQRRQRNGKNPGKFFQRKSGIKEWDGEGYKTRNTGQTGIIP